MSLRERRERRKTLSLSAMGLVVLQILTLRYDFYMKKRSEILEICTHYGEHVGVAIAMELIFFEFLKIMAAVSP